MKGMFALFSCMFVSGTVLAAAPDQAGSARTYLETLHGLAQSGAELLDESQLDVLRSVLSEMESTNTDGQCHEATGLLAPLALRANKNEEVQEDVLAYLRDRLSVDVSPRAYAVLYDKVKQLHKAPQEFGTIFKIERDAVVAYSASNAMKFNEMRDTIGLVPVEVEARVVNDLASIYKFMPEKFEHPGVYDCRFMLQGNSVRRELKVRSDASSQARDDWQKDGFSSNTEVEKRAQEEDSKSADWLRQSIDKDLLFSGTGVDRQDIFETALLVQHSGRMDLMKEALPIFAGLMVDGRFNRAVYAVMVDRILVFEKKKQIYGSQGVDGDGKVVPGPMVAPSEVNARRRLMNMMTIEDYYEELNR